MTKKLKLLNLLLFAIVAIMGNTVLASNIMPIGCDDGLGKDVFEVGETVCVYGTGFNSSSSVDIYLVDDVSTYMPEDTLVDVTGSVERITINDNGVLVITPVWNSIISGEYDLIADTNMNGLFDEGEPVNIGSGIGLMASLQENADVPEFSTIGALVLLMAIGFYVKRARK